MEFTHLANLFPFCFHTREWRQSSHPSEIPSPNLEKQEQGTAFPCNVKPGF